MMAVIETGGKQHRVRVGDVVRVESLPAEAGATVAFDRVLMVGEGGDARIGTPTVEGARVTGTVVMQGRGAKVIGYLFKHRKNSNRKRWGHRQNFTAVKIDAIEA
ncbi:MAG: 50S ribosomal protein L21 [Acidobacteriia bacterium]|nr:50S ribosomal protein L21 [Terriglobia bacterium]